MALVVCNSGKQQILENAFDISASLENLEMHLYLTNITPAETDTASTYSGNEASFTGYSEVTLSNGGVTSAAPAVASWDDAVFSVSSDSSQEDVYGYYVLGASSGALWWAEKFVSPSPPYPMATSGSSITVSPVFNGASA